MSSPDWRDRAACRRSDPNLFSQLEAHETAKRGMEPTRHPRVRRALALCAGCPVRLDCLEEAHANRESGIWGGEYLPQKFTAPKRVAS